MNPLQNVDPEIFNVVVKETNRLEQELNLIASENYASQAVLEATGSVLTNKYAEGYSGKRYYAGCQFVDEAENLAIERIKQLFNAEHANVQPHAGSQANMAVYAAVLEPGDTILGMALAAGGHLTHGHKVNISGKIFNSVQYHVHPETELLDYDEIEKLALEHKPKLIIAGASAYSRTIDFERFATIAKKVGAYFMADVAHIAGLIVTEQHLNPFPHADFVTSTTHKTLRGPRGGLIMCKKKHADLIDRAIMPGTQGGPFMHSIAAKAVAFYEALQAEFIEYQQIVVCNAQKMVQSFKARDYRIVTDGTDNHLFIVDLRSKNINGRQAEVALQKAGITVSRSCIPFDPAKPWITSGIRIGTPAITTRGMQPEDMDYVVQLIDQAIMNYENPSILDAVKTKVDQFMLQFPIYGPAVYQQAKTSSNTLQK